MSHRMLLLIPALFLALFASGCGVSQADIEKSVREGMKTKLSVDVASIDLKKQENGSYLGTATAQTGDVYDVVTVPPKDNKVEWNAIPGQAMVEKTVRTGLETQLSTKVKSLQLTKSAPGTYSGPAELESGSKVMVKTHLEGAQLMWEAKPIEPGS